MKKIIQNCCFVIKQIWKISRSYFVYSFFWVVLFSLYQFCWVLTLPYAINNVINQENIMLSFILLGICFLYCIFVDSLFGLLNQTYVPRIELKIKKELNNQIYKKAMNTDIISYDNTQYYDEFILSSSNYPTKALEIISTIRNFFFALFVLLGTTAIIISYDWIVLIIMIVSFGLNYILTDKDNKSYYKYQVEVTRGERKRDYFQRIFYLRQYAKELRLNKKIANKFTEEYRRSNNIVRDIKLEYSFVWSVIYILKYVFVGNIINQGLVYTVLAYQLIVSQSITIGGVYAIYNSIGSFYSKVNNIITLIPELTKSGLYVEKVRNFLESNSEIISGDKIPEILNDNLNIIVKDMTFSYIPNAFTLKHINMDISRGQHIAIVGYNGSGKTTLVKLLMRLYECDSGEIVLDKTTLREYNIEEYRKLFATVYQDFQLFSFSILENITMDSNPPDIDLINNILDKVQMSNKINSLQNGIYTNISAEFDSKGTDFSGGEKQRLAIARILYNKKPIIILDEPSSALDPLSEYNLNKLISNELRDNTVIYISHRLSTTMFADRIYMMKEGQIIENGTHDELMLLNGEYSNIFRLQAQKFGVEA